MYDRAMRLDRLNRAIDRIRSKYGFEAIKRGRMLKVREIFTEGKYMKPK